jgi:hypothetical protein
MGCKQYTEIIAEAALEAARPAREAELRAHLAGCAACRAALEAQKLLVAAIDRDVAASVAAEPSPDFAARVRVAVEVEHARANYWVRTWMTAAAGALAVFALVATWTVRRGLFPHKGSEAAAQVQLRPSPSEPAPRTEDAPLAVVASPSGAHQTGTRRAGRGERVTRGLAARAAASAVIIPRGQEEAVLRLYLVLQSGRAELSPAPGESDSPAPEELKIIPLDVSPLETEAPGRPGGRTGTEERRER